MKKNILSLLTLSAFVFLGACAKDKDQDSYNRKKRQDDLARIQVAEGRYSGLVTSQVTGEAMGAMEVNIAAQTRSAQGGNSATDSEAVLVVGIRFVGDRGSNVTAQNAYFDPDRRDITARLTITRNGMAEEVSLRGIIPGPHFEGTIEATNYPGYGGKFVLTKNGGSPDSLWTPDTAGSDAPLYSKSFKSFTTFYRDGLSAKKNTVPATFVVIQPNSTPELNFLNNFVPVKSVQITVNYSDSMRLFHANGLWDQQNNTLTGSLNVRDLDTNLTSTEVLNLACASTGLGNDLAWTCNHSSSSSGVVATTKTFSDNRAVADTVGATTAPVSISYNRGVAEYEGQDGKRKTAKVKLRALLQTRTRDQRLTELLFPVRTRALQLTLSFTFPGGSTPLVYNFNAANTRWDIANGTLQATASNTVGDSYTQTFSCSNFNFDKFTDSFECEYFSTFAADTFRIKFSPDRSTMFFDDEAIDFETLM